MRCDHCRFLAAFYFGRRIGECPTRSFALCVTCMQLDTLPRADRAPEGPAPVPVPLELTQAPASDDRGDATASRGRLVGPAPLNDWAACPCGNDGTNDGRSGCRGWTFTGDTIATCNECGYTRPFRLVARALQERTLIGNGSAAGAHEPNANVDQEEPEFRHQWSRGTPISRQVELL